MFQLNRTHLFFNLLLTMKKAVVILLWAFFVLPFNNSFGQVESFTSKTGINLQGIYLGGLASTNGFGGEIKYIFNNWLTVKSGYEALKFYTAFDFDENGITYDANLDYKTGGIFLLGDFNFTRNLYASTGIIFNSFNPDMQGHSVSDLEYGDISIPASKVGDFNFTVSPSMKVSPYGGLGVRSFMGRTKRVVMNAEVGMYYLGPPKIGIEATGLLAPTADPAHGQKEKLEKQVNQYKFYPVLKLNLGIRM